MLKIAWIFVWYAATMLSQACRKCIIITTQWNWVVENAASIDGFVDQQVMIDRFGLRLSSTWTEILNAAATLLYIFKQT